MGADYSNESLLQQQWAKHPKMSDEMYLAILNNLYQVGQLRVEQQRMIDGFVAKQHQIQ